MRGILLALGRGCRGLALLGKRLLGALVIGLATVLLPKAQPDQHWSEPPVIDVVADYDQTVRSGDDPLGDDTPDGSGSY
jgi:hypothetical protein